eukprot:CAMPEP_0198129508 /NCGR_PEP_ID=MMETSP1442-20131203/51913_1 /TAXON_ID= /ORGANISM="Craspedostauros australis, Strain CCMP3328" /LENGTH=145 /DNA_ID=CAMNT_0043789919 /DNA_START=373 /DNA_END=806 /DNA_ORIENTATION=+
MMNQSSALGSRSQKQAQPRGMPLMPRRRVLMMKSLSSQSPSLLQPRLASAGFVSIGDKAQINGCELLASVLPPSPAPMASAKPAPSLIDHKNTSSDGSSNNNATTTKRSMKKRARNVAQTAPSFRQTASNNQAAAMLLLGISNIV